jgi:hypothetical protein
MCGRGLISSDQDSRENEARNRSRQLWQLGVVAEDGIGVSSRK